MISNDDRAVSFAVVAFIGGISATMILLAAAVYEFATRAC